MTAPTERLTSAQRGYSYKWQQYRVSYLAKHPLCVQCKERGVVSAASVVDHKTPPRMAEALATHDQQVIQSARRLFWNPENHQSLCATCHSSDKQRLEKSGTVAGCDQSGIPLDANHHWNIHK